MAFWVTERCDGFLSQFHGLLAANGHVVKSQQLKDGLNQPLRHGPHDEDGHTLTLLLLLVDIVDQPTELWRATQNPVCHV